MSFSFEIFVKARAVREFLASECYFLQPNFLQMMKSLNGHPSRKIRELLVQRKTQFNVSTQVEHRLT
jgi:hypothetical protein